MTDTAPDTARGSDRRAEIVEAAYVCFLRWGVAKTHMDDIAKAVGIARPNLYRYFPSKEALVLAVTARNSQRIHASRRDQLPIDGPVAELLERSLTMAVEEMLADPFAGDLMTSPDQGLMAAAMEHTDDRLAYWQPIFDHGRERGELRSDLSDEDLLHWLTTMQLHFMTNPQMYPTIDEITRDVRRFVVPAMLALSRTEHSTQRAQTLPPTAELGEPRLTSERNARPTQRRVAAARGG